MPCDVQSNEFKRNALEKWWNYPGTALNDAEKKYQLYFTCIDLMSCAFPSVHAVVLILVPECFSGCCSCRCLCLLTQTVSGGDSLRPDTRQTSEACAAHALHGNVCGWSTEVTTHSNALLHRPHRASFKLWRRQTSYEENSYTFSTLLQFARKPTLRKKRDIFHSLGQYTV